MGRKKEEKGIRGFAGCGDSIKADVIGAYEAGIYPVLYEGNIPDEEKFFTQQDEGKTVDFDYLHICDWKELTALFQLCRQ